MSETTSRLRELDFFIGAWHATGRFHDTPFLPGKPVEMRIEGSTEDDGTWTVVRTRELETADNPSPLTARYFWGYEQNADVFTAEWFDSNGGRATQRSAGWIGDVLVFEGVMTVGGRSFPLRDTFTRKGEDHYHHVGEVGQDADWIPVDEEDVRRVS